MNDVELLVNFFITALSAGGVGFFVVRQVLQLVDKRLDANNKAQEKQLEIALKDKEGDIATAQAGQANLQALVQLLQTQLQQIPQLTVRIGELVDRMDSNQRQSSMSIDTILQAYRRDVDLLTVGFRTITDTHILQSTALNRATSVVEEGIKSIQGVAAGIQSGFYQMRVDDARSQENLDEVVEMVVEMRNTVMRLTGHGDINLIRPPSDDQHIRAASRESAADNIPVLAAVNTDSPTNETLNPTTEEKPTSAAEAAAEGTTHE